MTYPDAVQELIDLLEKHWNMRNTGSRRPTIRKAWDSKRTTQMMARPNQDLIVVLETSRPVKLAGNGGAGNDAFTDHAKLQIDIRVVQDESQAYRVRNEVLRILTSNMQTGTLSFSKIIPRFDDHRNLSDKSVNLFRYLVPAELRTHRRKFT